MAIKSYVSRYVLPFYYENEKQGYDRLCKSILTNDFPASAELPSDGRWVESGFWEDYKSNSSKQSEREVYSYLYTLFQNHSYENVKDVSNLGASFMFKTNGSIFEIYYRNDNMNRLRILCNECGLIVLKNGIGFLWFDVHLPEKISETIYVKFQNDFKELARTHTNNFEKKVGYDPDKRKGIFESFCLGVWVSDFLNVYHHGIHFWGEKNISRNKSDVCYIPDKLLLFQYLFVDDKTEQECKNTLFRITNGYDEKYVVPNNSVFNVCQPFGNTSFYITKSGMGCIVSNNDTNEEFFKNQFKDKITRDYFFIYLLLCYQSYSCSHYSRCLAMLPSEEGAFREETGFIHKLDSFNSQINLFLVKSIFDSVSNAHHQNEVYRYGKKVLCINEDIESLTIGLESINNIEKEKQEEKLSDEKEKKEEMLNIALAVFGLFSVSSAYLDGFGLVDWIVNNLLAGDEISRVAGYIVYATFISVVTVWVVWVLVLRIFKKR